MQTKVLIVSPEEAKRLETTYRVVRRSVDARQRILKVNITLLTDDKGNYIPKDAPIPLYTPPTFVRFLGTSSGRARDMVGLDDSSESEHTTEQKRSAFIIGAGPSGLFAALTLLEHGIKPIIYERGKQVSERKRDIALLNRNEGLNPESNYCFGEGGAGTFSDGKLFSRSKKRGNMQRVMELFHYFGAPDTVLYEAHAHIGSDKLPQIIRNIRECILAHGGEIHFGACVDKPLWRQLMQSGVPVIVAIGHSAHDTYRMLAAEGVRMEAKGFAMGVRSEHPQALINKLIYHNPPQSTIDLVGNASYSLVTQVNGRGVYSFCMCPGGHIVPAGSSNDGCVVNGMSASHRNSPFANSGMVVELHPDGDAIAALDMQEHLERLAKQHGGPMAQAPAQRMKDFVEGRESKDLPACSYLPGIIPSRLDQWLPREIGPYLQQGFRDFDKKYPGFLTNDALIVGVESRSSSPVRIIRDPDTLQSPSHPAVYPCGEGAGYAGGITSSALDGINAALKICQLLNEPYN